MSIVYGASRILFRLIILANVVTLLLYLGAWSQTSNIRNRDFLSFYTASALPYTELYDIDSQREMQRRVLGEPFPVPAGVLPFVNPPFIVPLLKIVCSEDYSASYWRWRVLMLLLSVTNTTLIYAILLRKGWDRKAAALAAWTALLFLPIYLSIAKGQLSAFVGFAPLACAWALLNGRSGVAGAALSLSLVKPHVALALACALLLIRPSAFVYFVIASSVLAAFSLWFVGTAGAGQLLEVSHRVAASDDYGAAQGDMVNLLGLLLRSGVEAGAARPTAWLAYAVALACALLVGRYVKEPLQALGLSTLLAVLFVPHLHFHDLILLLVPMTAAAESLKVKGAGVALLAFLPLSFLPLLFLPYAAPYVIVLALAALLLTRATPFNRLIAPASSRANHKG